MNIQNTLYSGNLLKHSATGQNNVTFTATLPEIREAVDNATTKELCPGKKKFLNQLIKFFEEFQKQLAKKFKQDSSYPETFEFKLGEINQIPEKFNTIIVRNKGTIGDVDKQLNQKQYSCGTDKDCTCGKGITAGRFLAETIFKKILNVNKPNVIEIDIKNSK